MLAKYPNLLDAQFSYCKSKINQDHSYDMTVASSAFSHLFSLLINAEKTLDHMLRLKCQNQPVDFMAPFISACLSMFQHFFEQASLILETQNLLYYQILLVYMQIGNLIHKVAPPHQILAFSLLMPGTKAAITKDEQSKAELVRSLVVVLEDHESYLHRRTDSYSPHLHISNASEALFEQSRATYVDPYLSSLFDFLNQIYDIVSFEFFLKSIDLLDYTLILFPFTANEVEGQLLHTLKTIETENSLAAASRTALILDANRVIARSFIIRRQKQLSSQHPIWPLLISVLGEDHSAAKFQEKFCYALILVGVGQALVQSNDQTLIDIFKRLSVTASSSPQTSMQLTPHESADTIERILALLTSILKALNLNLADPKDLILENLEEIISGSEEIAAKVDSPHQDYEIFEPHNSQSRTQVTELSLVKCFKLRDSIKEFAYLCSSQKLITGSHQIYAYI